MSSEWRGLSAACADQGSEAARMSREFFMRPILMRR
jgi:hypothetical protein